MKTTMKKVLSMALALVLVLGVMPFQAFATGHAHQWIDSENGTHHVCQDSTCPATEEHTATTWRSDYTGHWRVCTVCNANFAFAPHTAEGTVDCVNASTCSVCDATIAALGHDTSGPAATCGTSKVCARSGCSAELEHYHGIDAPDQYHNFVEIEAGVAATCTSAGKEATYQCTNGCGKTIGGEAIPATGNHTPSNGYSSDATHHWQICGTGDAAHIVNKTTHTWNAATATTPKTCSVCGYSEGNALGSATINVKLLIGGTAQNAGSFSITAGGNKTANDILNTYLANSTYSASSISSSYVVDGSSTQYTGNQSVAITAGSTYVLYVTPVNSTNNTQSNTNGIYVSFVPNYNTYTYATYVAGPLEQSGVKLYTIPHNITRTGYTLEGWYYDAALTKKVPTDAVVTTSATFYAKWTQIAPYNVSVVIYTNGNKQTPTVTLDLYEWAQDGVITLADLQQAVVKQGIKANNNAGLSVYGPFTPNQWTSYVSHDYFRNSTERVSVNAGEATVLYAMVHNVKITKGTVDPYGAIADKSNPKTGDMIYAPMMVLGLSASALAVLFYLNKKRAF